MRNLRLSGDHDQFLVVVGRTGPVLTVDLLDDVLHGQTTVRQSRGGGENKFKTSPDSRVQTEKMG